MLGIKSFTYRNDSFVKICLARLETCTATTNGYTHQAEGVEVPSYGFPYKDLKTLASLRLGRSLLEQF